MSTQQITIITTGEWSRRGFGLAPRVPYRYILGAHVLHAHPSGRWGVFVRATGAKLAGSAYSVGGADTLANAKDAALEAFIGLGLA